MPRSRKLLILGAGFSTAAGLPLGRELMGLIREQASLILGPEDYSLDADIDRFIRYKQECDGKSLSRDEVDLEELVGFLDIEHALRLSGSDTLTEFGNPGQLVIRYLIGRILFSRTPKEPEQFPQVYHDFVSRLEPGDTILTFNYDLVLETLLDYHKKPFRLFPSRFASVLPNGSASVADNDQDIVIRKLHGSLDWLYYQPYHQDSGFVVDTGSATDLSLVGLKNAKIAIRPLTDGPRPPQEVLSNLHRIRDIDSYYCKGRWWEAPYLLAPSSMKALYAQPLRALWHGLGEVGAYNLGLAIIGFSMPDHDEYLRQLVYSAVSNYQNVEPDLEIVGRRKAPVVVVDMRKTPQEIESFRTRYAFVDWTRTISHFDGLTQVTLDDVFRDIHATCHVAG